MFERRTENERRYGDKLHYYNQSGLDYNRPTDLDIKLAHQDRDSRKKLKQDRVAERHGYILRGRKNHETDLASKFVGVFGIASLFSGLFFLSPNITGNVIGNSQLSGSNILGAIFLFLGLFCALVYFRMRN